MTAGASILQQACGEEVAHIVVLTSDHADASPGVLDQAAREGVQPTVTGDALRAFSDLSLCDRLDAARSAWGLPHVGRTVLVLDALARNDDLPALRDAIGRYVDRVIVVEHNPAMEAPWRAGDGRTFVAAGPSIARVAAPVAARTFAPTAPVARAADRVRPPALRLVATDAPRPSIAPASIEIKAPVVEPRPAAGVEDEPLVTREELAMLLATDDDGLFPGEGERA